MSQLTVPPPASAARNDALDTLRGLLLVLMTLTHLPTALSGVFGQPLGYASAAEGFVLLSAYLIGRIGARRQLRSGFTEMRRDLVARAARVYRAHMMLILFGLTVVLTLGLVNGQTAITGLFSYYLREPLAASLGAAVLLYQPPLLDILPMYVLFMLASPFALRHAQRHGWLLPLGCGALIWAGSLLGLRDALYALVVASTGLPIPVRATGAFDPLSWQFLWLIGLCCGASSAAGTRPAVVSPGRLGVAVAVGLVLLFLVWRHVAGYAAFGPGSDFNRLFGKWQLGPLRLVNVLALMVVVEAFGAQLARRLPLAPLTRLGRASLWVFCAHLVCCLLALAMFGPASRSGGGGWLDLGLLLVTFGTLQITAAVHAARNAPVEAPAPSAATGSAAH